MNTPSTQNMTRARPLLRQLNLLLLATLAGLLIGRSLPTVDSGLALSTQVSAEEEDAEAHRTAHAHPADERLSSRGQRN